VDGDAWSVRGAIATPTATPEGCIDASIACRVADLARQLEERFGAPQDIEWASLRRLVVRLGHRSYPWLQRSRSKGTWQKDTEHYAGPVTPFSTCIFKHYDWPSLR
jgi:phosphoenolpyruvate synthase/pyruvate phosphate dikinase